MRIGIPKPPFFMIEPIGAPIKNIIIQATASVYFSILAILNLPSSLEFSFTPSTSKPICVSLSIISKSLAFVFKCSLLCHSQGADVRGAHGPGVTPCGP